MLILRKLLRLKGLMRSRVTSNFRPGKPNGYSRCQASFDCLSALTPRITCGDRV
jgi:hypothetical protein